MSFKKLLVISNIISVIPGILLVPLVPFTFILIYGEGTIPGMLQENILKSLMILYPFVLVFGIFSSIKQYRRNSVYSALLLSVAPFFHAILITIVFIFGGIQLR